MIFTSRSSLRSIGYLQAFLLCPHVSLYQKPLFKQWSDDAGCYALPIRHKESQDIASLRLILY